MLDEKATVHPTDRGDGMGSRVRWLVIVQSGFYRTALQLGNIPIVLPFVVAELNASVWMAALVFPAFTGGGAIGNLLAPKALDAIPRSHRLFLIVMCLAALAAGNALCATLGGGNVAASVILINAIAIGAISAFAFVAFSDLVASMPSGQARAQILLTEAGAGAALTAAASMALLSLPHAAESTRNITLLWASSAAMAISGVICLALPRSLVPASHLAPGLRELLRIGWATVRAESWYRRYLFVQVLFGSVILAPSFYSIRAAALPGDEHDHVVLFVIVVCVGLFAAIPLWHRTHEKFGLAGLFVGSAIVAVAAAVIAITAQLSGSWPNVVAIGVIIVLAAIANQSVFAAGQLWIAHFAGPHLRIALISFGQLVIGAGLIALSSLLGVLGGRTDAVWPVVIVLVLNLIAAYAAKRFAPGDPETECALPEAG